MRRHAEAEHGRGRFRIAGQVVEIRAAGALQVPAALAQHADVEQRRVELRVQLERVIERGLGLGGAPQAVVGDAEVIRGVGAERGVLVGEDAGQVGRRLRVVLQAQIRERAIEARVLQGGRELERAIEAGDGALRIAVEQECQSAQVLDLGRRRARRLRSFELAQRGVVVALQDVPDAAVAGGVRGRGKKWESEEEQRGEPDQAAPRTCSSIWMSPRFTALTNASTTFGSKRVPAKLLIFSTT